MKKIINLLGLLVLAVSFQGCLSDNDDQNCLYYQGEGTLEVIGETEAIVGTVVPLEVKFRVFDSCGEFYMFHEEVVNTTTKIITVNAVYDGCNCTVGSLVKSAVYNFRALTVGTHTLRFRINNSTFIEHVIEVTLPQD